MSERLGRSQSAYLQHKKDKNITLPEAPWDDAETETPEDLE